MTISIRPYGKPSDFELVRQFLIDTYVPGGRHPNWLPARFEYALTHSIFQEENINKIGIWEDGGHVVGMANYELRLGMAFLQIHPQYAHLKPEMLAYAEQHLCAEDKAGRRYLRVMVHEFDSELEALASQSGYTKQAERPDWTSQFTIPNPFPAINLPVGFTLKSLADENDLRKINRVMYRGFNHPGEPPEEYIEGRGKMQSGPNFRHDLTITVHAPNGDYAAFAGLWYEPALKVSYVEPVATDPTYRRMGLGTAAVLEGIRRTAELGATVAYVISEQPFYLAMGFEKAYATYPWIKYLD